jgi:hypothetical protein
MATALMGVILILYKKRQASTKLFSSFFNGERGFFWRASGTDTNQILEENNDQ